MSFFRGCFLAAVIAVLFAGCSGGGAEQKPTHRVVGTVAMAGGPVAGATVMFAPTEGQPVATGITDTSGKYELTTYEGGDGAVKGTFKVLVMRSAKAKKDDGELDHDAFASGESDPTSAAHDGEEESAAGSDSSLPAKYADSESTDLLATVEDKSENVIDLTLEP
jgi:hypothetical protein